MNIGIEKLTQAIVRDLQTANVKIIQAVKVESTVDGSQEIWCKCIDEDDLHAQEKAIASISTPDIAKQTYQKNPVFFYAQVEDKGTRLKASRMSSDDIKKAKQSANDNLIRLKKLF